MMLHWLTTIILAFAITLSVVEDNILLGLPFFIVAIVNEAIAAAARVSVLNPDDQPYD